MEEERMDEEEWRVGVSARTSSGTLVRMLMLISPHLRLRDLADHVSERFSRCYDDEKPLRIHLFRLTDTQHDLDLDFYINEVIQNQAHLIALRHEEIALPSVRQGSTKAKKVTGAIPEGREQLRKQLEEERRRILRLNVRALRKEASSLGVQRARKNTMLRNIWREIVRRRIGTDSLDMDMDMDEHASTDEDDEDDEEEDDEEEEEEDEEDKEDDEEHTTARKSLYKKTPTKQKP